MIKSKKWTLILLGISIFLITELISLYLTLPAKTPLNKASQRYHRELGGKLSGNILVTGDTQGYYETAGCERIGSLTRRAALIKKIPDALYFDTGNFTPESEMRNNAYTPLLTEAYRDMNIAAMNLTKWDFISLLEAGVVSPTLDFVSANFTFNSPESFKKSVSKYKFLPFILKSKSGKKEISIAVTGITHNLRRMHHGKISYSVNDIESSLNAIMKDIAKADLKVLLFNDSSYTLRKLIEEDRIHFDLIIAHSTLPEQMDTLEYIKKTPVVFHNENGRSLGVITVAENSGGFAFDYEALQPGMGAPEEKSMLKLTYEIEENLINGSKDKSNLEKSNVK